MPRGTRSRIVPGRDASRRAFLQALGATAVPLLAGWPALAQPPAPSPTPPPEPPPDPEKAADAAEARAQAEILERRYGAGWTEEQKAELQADLEGGCAAGRALRALRLANADEPDVVFRALPLGR
jgi:hypothetical protein